MKIKLLKFKLIVATVLMLFSFHGKAKVFEWRLVNNTFSAVDPDAGGPALGSVTFTMQIHTVSGSVPDVSAISTGWSYQSAKIMIPTTPGCAVVSNPANVVLSPA